MSLPLLSDFFLLLSAAMAALVVGGLLRTLSGRARVIALAGFAAWLIYATVLGAKGVIAAKSPPGLAFLLLPTLVFLIGFLTRSPGVKPFAARVPVTWLVGLQTFRVLVELTLYGLFLHHLVPRLMTFEGGNLDILTGLSAPIVAWLYTTRRIGESALRGWSWTGLVLLGNAVLRAALTSSGRIHAEVPNLAIGLFPFTFLPGLLVPLALTLHVLVLRSLPRAHPAEPLSAPEHSR